jgi:hypothetical protein
LAALTTEASTKSEPRRAAKGALSPAPRGGVHPCFTLLIVLGTLDCAALLFLPYIFGRDGDSPWASAPRAAFLGKAIASGLAFGLTASISADRRNRSPWWFLAGHVGVLLAAVLSAIGQDLSSPFGSSLAVVAAGFVGSAFALVTAAKPKEAPAPLDPLLLGLCRLVHATSNVKFGVALMAIVAIAVQFGSIHENRFNSRAAHHDVYRSWWFVSLWFVAGISMLSATFRKWPWRLEQAGWLTTHAGLTIVVVGTMMSYFSSVEGQLALSEGESGDAITLDGASRIRIDEIGRGEDGRRFRRRVLDAKSGFDADPTTLEPHKAFSIPLGSEGGDATLVVDRYYCHARPFENWFDDGDKDRAGIEIDVFIGDATTPARTLKLDEIDRPTATLPFGSTNLQIELPRLNAAVYEALTRKDRPEGHGRLILRDATGTVVGETPVVAESRKSGVDDGEPAVAKGSIVVGGVEATLVSYADNLGRFPGAQGIVDLSAGIPKNPGVLFRLKDGDATEERTALAFLPPTAEEAKRHAASRFPFVAEYDYRPRLDLEGPLLLLAPTPTEFRYVYVSAAGDVIDGPIREGERLPLPAPMLRFIPTKTVSKLRVDRGFDFAGYKDDGPPAAIRVVVKPPKGEATTTWLRRDAEPEPFEIDGRLFAVSWTAERRALGFDLKLNEFLREFYPGSTSEKTFESYLELTHPTKFPKPADVKIDMNRPLRLDGWRLYQARFGADDKTTFLQVNRDPGLALIYPACCVVILGIVVVSFLKKGLRARRLKLDAEGSGAAAQVFEGACVVAAVGIGPLVFGIWAAVGLPASGALAFGLGVLFVAVVPALVVVRLSRSLAVAEPSATPTESVS